MKKLKILLSETSVINFPFIWKLVKRYPIGVIILPLFVIGASFYFYQGQNNIYRESLSFKNVADDSSSPTVALAALLGEKTKRLMPSEISGMHLSVNFNQVLAKYIYESGYFEKMNFNNIRVKQQNTTKEIFKDCKDEECIINKIRSIVSGFWYIEEDISISSVYHVNVKSLDKYTTETMMKILREQMGEYRRKSIQHFLVQQRELSERLVEKKKKEIDNVHLLEIKKEYDLIEDKLREIKNQLAIVRQNYHSSKSALERMNVSLKEKMNLKTNSKRVATSKRVDDLETKISTLRKNINEIELTSSSANIAESQIVASLKRELANKERELRRILPKRSLSSIANLKDNIGSDRNVDSYKVVKERFKSAESEFNTATEKLEVLNQRKATLRAELEMQQPSLDYLKLLENKLIQLRLLENTVVSDLLFDKFSSGVSIFKRTTLPFIIMFAIALSFFLSLVWLIIVYYFDDRVFSEEEIAQRFSDIPFLGSTPKFKD